MREVIADLHLKVHVMEGLGVALVQVLACLVEMVTGTEIGHRTETGQMGGDLTGTETGQGLDLRMTGLDGAIQTPVQSHSTAVSTRQIAVGTARLRHHLMVVVVSP